MYQNICPANYYCPTGTVDYITGELAGDAINRGMNEEESNPYINIINSIYSVNDDIRMISTHDLHCLNGIDNDYSIRFKTDWIKEGKELKNPYLSYLRKHVPGRNVPYSNDPFYTGHDVNDKNNNISKNNYYDDNFNYLSDKDRKSVV